MQMLEKMFNRLADSNRAYPVNYIWNQTLCNIGSVQLSVITWQITYYYIATPVSNKNDHQLLNSKVYYSENKQALH